MEHARLTFPIEDNNATFRDLVHLAEAQIHRICTDNLWQQAGEPTNWHTEGSYELVLVCELPVYVFDPDSYEALIERPVPEPTYLTDQQLVA